MINDRFTKGFIAGVVGGVIMNITNLTSYYVFDFAKLRYLDFAGVMIFGSIPNTFWEDSFALIAHIIFTGFLGIVFAYLMPFITSVNYLFKGWFYGAALWFFIYAVTHLLKVPELAQISIETAASNVIGVSAFGLVLAETLHRLDKGKNRILPLKRKS